MKTRLFVAAVVVLSGGTGSAHAEGGPAIQTASLQFRFGLVNTPRPTPFPQGSRFRRDETDRGSTKQDETRTCVSRILGRVPCPTPKPDQTKHDETKTCNTRVMLRPFQRNCATQKQDQAKQDKTTCRVMLRPFQRNCATQKQDQAKLDQATACKSRAMIRPFARTCSTQKQDRATACTPGEMRFGRRDCATKKLDLAKQDETTACKGRGMRVGRRNCA